MGTYNIVAETSFPRLLVALFFLRMHWLARKLVRVRFVPVQADDKAA